MIGNLIVRALGRIVRWLGVRTLLSLTLLLVALGSVALELANLTRGLNAALLLPLTASGVLLGWVLAKSPLPGWLAGVLAFILGTEAVAASVGRLGQPLAKLAQSVPHGSLLTPALAELGTAASTLLARLRDWSQALVQGQAAFDPLATALVWSLVLWLAAAWAGWAVRRRQRVLQGIVPAGALLATTLSYTWASPYALLTLLSATLLLMMLAGHNARERRWQADGIDYSPELPFDLAVAAIPLCLALVAASLFAPSLSVRPIVRLARRLMVEHLGAGKQVANSMGLDALNEAGVAFDQARTAGLPRRHLLGSRPELSQQVMMIVYPQERQPTGETLSAPPRYYWRSLTYDRYTGRGWYTGPTETTTYRAGEVANPTTFKLTVHQTLRQQVQAVADLGDLLYRAGELVTADQDYRIARRSRKDAFGAQIEATVYQADSLLPLVSEAQLRASGNDYPTWVRERYLALPNSVPQRVLTLAFDLTSAEPTPYDQARAIETYLRAFTYTLDLPAPPPNRDVADYFLFDLQQGYCDYYATAMVVLARATGLPARLVTGYASGTCDADNARYVVTAADAHSWVEIYFPAPTGHSVDYGWIEFEPTGGRPAIERPAEIDPLEIPEPLPALEPAPRKRIGLGWILGLGAMLSLAFLALAGLAWWVAAPTVYCIDGWRIRRMPPAALVAALYQRLYDHGRRLAVPLAAGDTPYEFETILSQRVTTLASGKRFGETATSTVREVRWLTDLYVRGLYSPQKPAAAERSQALKTWRRLRRKLWLAWLWQKGCLFL